MFAKVRRIESVGEGEHLAFLSAGALGYSVVNRYNARRFLAEVLMHGGQFALSTTRESFEPAIASERSPAWLKEPGASSEGGVAASASRAEQAGSDDPAPIYPLQRINRRERQDRRAMLWTLCPLRYCGKMNCSREVNKPATFVLSASE
jgi:hypothetical protein